VVAVAAAHGDVELAGRLRLCGQEFRPQDTALKMFACSGDLLITAWSAPRP
jgi:hypothetical protein